MNEPVRLPGWYQSDDAETPGLLVYWDGKRWTGDTAMKFRGGTIGRWLRQESFWRDVVTRTIAGLFVLAVSATAAGIVAALSSPAGSVWGRLLGGFACLLGGLLLFLVGVSCLSQALGYLRDGRFRIAAALTGIGVAAWAGLLALLALGSAFLRAAAP